MLNYVNHFNCQVFRKKGVIMMIVNENINQQELSTKILAEMTIKIRQSFQLKEIMQTTVLEVRKLLQIDRVIIYQILNDGSGQIVTEAKSDFVESILNQKFTQEVFPLEYQELYKKGRIREIEDIDNANVSKCVIDFLKLWRIKSSLIVPILVKEELWGLIIVHHCQGIRKWQSWEVELLKLLGDQVGIAINQSQMSVILKQSEKRYLAALNDSNKGLWDWNLSMNKVYFSPQWKGMLGYAEKEIGNNIEEWFNRIHIDDQKSFKLALSEHFDSQTTYFEHEHRLQKKDGTYCWIDVRGLAVRDQEGKVYRMSGTHTDINERKEAELELKRVTLALENAVEGIAQLDINGYYLTVNKAYSNMLGYEPEEMVGMHWRQTVYYEDIDKAIMTYKQMLVQGKGEVELKGLCKDGQIFYKQVVLVKALENQENKVFHYCFTKNISDRKQAEETLKKAQENLEKEVEKRTLELQSANLKLLEEIAERKRIEEVLRENQERSALILKGTNDGIWDWNLLTNQVYYSERWSEMLGYTEIEISHNCEEWFDRIHPEDLQRVKTELKAHLEGFTPQFESEHRILHKDYGYIWVLSRGFAVTNEHGEPYRMVGSLKNINNRKIVEEQLRTAAFYDRLTNLPNRLLFMERLQHTLSLTKRWEKYQFGVLFLDLDRFKVINESLGHSNGDELLVWMAAKIKSCLLPGDTVARIGGDEFAILLEDIEDINDTITVAKKIQAELKTPFCINGHEVFTTVSIGITVAGGGENIEESYYQQPENFLRDADIAMYRSKSLGKARYEIFNPEMHSQAVALLKLEIDLRRAIERKEFILNYQPIVCLKTGELLGFEALIRWQHPERGFISPIEFIPVAEETGLIVPIGLWVLEESCQQMQFWQQNLTVNSSLTISVNLSVKQFDQSNQLVEQIKGILQKNQCPAANLKFEITETLLMENKDAANELLFQIKGLGIDLNMDDFGTGYSSLSYLHRFPIDTLKIDRAFINLMGNNAEDSAIVNTIITLAHNLDMTVTAEGVETVEQLMKLQLMSCDYGQGYYFSRPVNKEKATELIIQNNQFSNTWQINWTEEQLKLSEKIKINDHNQELENTKKQLDQVIDQKIKLAAELQNSEQLYRYVIQTASEGIWIINTESKTTFINEKMSEMLGYTIEEMVDKHLFDFMEQEAQILATEYLAHRIYGMKEQHDFKFRCKNGDPAWAWLNTTPILDDNGKYAGVLAMITDITERKKAEITLKQQTERERLITQITQKIRQSLDLETILNTTVAEVRQFLCTDRVVVYKFNPDWSGNIIIESVENSEFSILGRQIHDICFDERYVKMYKQGRIKAIVDIYTANIQPCHRNLLAQYQIRANLIVPIIQKDNLWGLLIAHHCTDVKNWQDFEIELLRQLATQLTIAIQQSELYQELQLANKELHRLATSDGLTKVANRRSFDQYLEQQWLQAKQTNQYISLILCDIDFFKLYNDTYGHQAGDECLQKVAKTINESARSENDLAARYGGEEFAIILPNTTPEEGILLAERIRSVLIQLQLPHKNSKISDYITLSMGVASIIPQDNLSSSMLIYKADQALYQAKSSGRNCVKLQTL